MFRKILRIGPKEKQPVTKIYGLVAILDKDVEQCTMLNQLTQRTNKRLSKATLSGIRGTDFHCEQPGVRGNLRIPYDKNRTLTLHPSWWYHANRWTEPWANHQSVNWSKTNLDPQIPNTTFMDVSEMIILCFRHVRSTKSKRQPLPRDDPQREDQTCTAQHIKSAERQAKVGGGWSTHRDHFGQRRRYWRYSTRLDHIWRKNQD